MQKKILLLICTCWTTFIVHSQDFLKEFKLLQEKNDTVAQAKFLSSWESANPKDPELFIAYFNYYARMSMREEISLDSNIKSEQSLQVNDTATGKPVAYLNSSLKYKSDILQKGFDYIDKGIWLYPTRLDMRFGKIYMLGEAENYTEFTKSIVETIHYGNKINNAWTWKEGKPLDNAKKFFIVRIILVHIR